MQRVPPSRSRLATGAVAALATTVLIVNLVWLRGDVTDMRRLREPYDVLVAQAERFADSVPTDRTVICVRLEHTDPLRQLHESGSAGLPKVYFQRGPAPYGLANWAQLFTYVRSTRGGDRCLIGMALLGGVCACIRDMTAGATRELARYRRASAAMLRALRVGGGAPGSTRRGTYHTLTQRGTVAVRCSPRNMAAERHSPVDDSCQKSTRRSM